MNWVVLTMLSTLTLGLFWIFWLFRQAWFARRIDPRSLAGYFYAAASPFLAMQVFDRFASLFGFGRFISIPGAAIQLLSLAGFVCLFTGYFSIRKSMLNYYNSPEDAGLRLSPAMIFFFGPIYLQYHLTQIADAQQRTGLLSVR